MTNPVYLPEPAPDEKELGISLGYPFDQLLRQDCPLEVNPHSNKPEERRYKRGIVLPSGGPYSPGTGNIIICGRPGSGKSTLAMQFAVACVHNKWNAHKFASAYISLEEETERVKSKAENFGWKKYFHKISQLHDVSPSATPDGLAKILKSILTQPRVPPTEKGKIACPFHGPFSENSISNNYNKWINGKECCCDHSLLSKRAMPCVLLPSLSPRPVSSTNNETSFFLERYAQLDNLLSAASKLRKENKNIPALRLVCIDSLNMFGFAPLSREELYRLFDLFRRNEMIGVFVVETSQETAFDSTMADVIISLHAEEDRSYFVRYLEIEKSRFYPQVYGKHFFKTVPISSENREAQENPESADASRELSSGIGCVVYPSLHYLSSRISRIKSSKMEKNYFEFGIEGLQEVLPKNVLKPGSVIAIEGPLGTFKSSLAMGFLAYGLANDKKSKKGGKNIEENKSASVLLIHLNDQPVFEKNGSVFERNGKEEIAYRILPNKFQFAENKMNFGWDKLTFCGDDKGGNYNYLKSLTKYVPKASILIWKNEISGARLIEVDFKHGAIFPEEFVQVVREIFRVHNDEKLKPINRVVLDDVSLIGLCYPFLRKSRTTEDQFLSIFVQIMRNMRVDLVMTGTTGEAPEANDAVRRACSLADTVLSCRLCEIYGDRYVTVQSEGLLAVHEGKKGLSRDPVPALIRFVPQPHQDTSQVETFEVNTELLQGLVGFQAGNIRRPGISLHLFEGNGLIHKMYNQSIETFLKSAFAVPFPREPEQSHPPERIMPRWFDKGMESAVERGIERAIEKESPSVTISTFDSAMSESVHDSINVLREKPFDRTVLVTLDEFWGAAAPYHKAQGMLCRLEEPQIKAYDKYFEDSYRHENSSCMRPYYANVLILAYRNDIVSTGLTKWLESVKNRKTWGQLAKSLKTLPIAQKKNPAIKRRFWYDRSADETLSCGLMSALISGSGSQQILQSNKYKEDKGEQGKIIHKILKRPNYFSNRTVAQNEIKAFSQLLIHAGYDLKNKPDNMSDEEWQNFKGAVDSRVLPKDSAVYLCWYSQLRELIHSCPELAPLIDICEVPGGGFRGDWFIGIVRGSVSESLGRSVLTMLTDFKEEYKRFAKGVGLPVHKKFLPVGNKQSPQFYAWPGTTKVHLKKVMDIYSTAYSRAQIDDYEKFRSILYMIGHQIGPKYNPKYPPINVCNIVNRLSKQINLLAPN